MRVNLPAPEIRFTRLGPVKKMICGKNGISPGKIFFFLPGQKKTLVATVEELAHPRGARSARGHSQKDLIFRISCIRADDE